VMKFLRQFKIHHGIAHAFNGSQSQANAFIGQGLMLGFGGAMTYTRALQIRRLAQTLPLTHIVLETDSPDLAPSWKVKGQSNEPAEIAAIATHLAALRGQLLSEIIAQTRSNAYRALPKLELAFSQPQPA
jgi:TatD DNase family protein